MLRLFEFIAHEITYNTVIIHKNSIFFVYTSRAGNIAEEIHGDSLKKEDHFLLRAMFRCRSVPCPAG
ncbi:hypothetical protein D8M06_11165 [Oceanobacillus halophilus]|uniref:Uncharacterized protein n=1 Tax=Oceanobacillus halophilus TaxID=930130 RepID=A0A495A0I4_9BACI|nr:hypothetical protein D8M06_11165 [Oceanobacillus halophilus]